MTPSDIEILLHHYVCPDPHPRADAPAVQETIREFVEYGILEEAQIGNYITTEKGKALVALLCRTEMPQQAWVDKDGDVILKEKP